MDLDSILGLIENVRKYEVKDINDNDIKEILEVSKKLHLLQILSHGQ